ncbi:MAG: hypothetical protein WCV88_04280 [Patescibacteria group bacterium]|jgi:hypothetical protein
MQEFSFVQWLLRVYTDRYEILNLSATGVKRFYAVIMGKYGQPILVADPDLAFDVPTCFQYVNINGDPVNPTEKIAGIICKDGPRFSLTSALDKGVVVKPNSNGSIQVGDETWYPATFFSKDKNRIIGYDAFLVKERREIVRILELGDLDLF